MSLTSPTDHRLPHALRLMIFFLRLALGVSFFYLGWGIVFNHSLGLELSKRSFAGLYAWLGGSSPFASIPSVAIAWAFLTIGGCLILGLFTRLAAIIAVALIIANLLQTISFSSFSPTQLVNDELVALFSLFVLFFGKAGTYLGLDRFIHFSMGKKK